MRLIFHRCNKDEDCNGSTLKILEVGDSVACGKKRS